jgi:hypothetical protein
MKFFISLILIVSSYRLLADEKFPIAALDRPVTMPTNVFESSILFTKEQVAQLDFHYGMTDNFQLGASWDGIETTTLNIAQKLTLHAAQHLFSTHWAGFMANLNLPLHFEGNILQEIHLGLPTYFMLIPHKLGLVIFEDLLEVHWSEQTTAQLKFQTHLAWQASQSLCLGLVTDWGSLDTSGNHTHMGQIIPLHLRVLYAITPKIDVVGSAGYEHLTDIKKPSLYLGIVFRGGSIGG